MKTSWQWRLVTRLSATPAWRVGLLLSTAYTAAMLWRRFWGHPFDRLPLGGVGAEIGVYRGIHARQLLRRHPGIYTLYLVDPYRPYPDSVLRLDHAEADARRRLARYADRVCWVREASPDCALWLPPLDWCYIDADHSQAAVRADLNALWPLVRPGGILGGDDWHNGCPGVIRAVCEFAVWHEVMLYVEGRDWWVVKPKEDAQ